MRKQFTLIKNLFNVLVVVILGLGLLAAHSAMADNNYNDGTFSNASLQGTYAYVNNSGDVASLGPLTFDGNGGLRLDIIANLPCESENTIANCPRTINDLPPANGNYSVEKDGTGVATIFFSTGTVAYNFIISKTERRGRTLVARQVFSAGQKGGLAGQLIAPTWYRIFD